jgi:D-glycero-alpha-D-manno-heptose-7-phosphate kinase
MYRKEDRQILNLSDTNPVRLSSSFNLFRRLSLPMPPSPPTPPIRRISAAAPIRICDLGGWTDTWFAGKGRVLNIGVYPFVEVQIDVYPRSGREHQVFIEAENYGDRYAPRITDGAWDKHPLLEAAIAHMAVPDDLALVVNIFSEAPAGASTGTSAAVTVALIGALSRVCGRAMSADEIARTAHHVEYDILGLQCGVQDQYCSAYGGISFMEIDAFPAVSVQRIELPNELWWELERRLLLVYLGSAHSSSDVHRRVIEGLEREGGSTPSLDAMRHAAEEGRDAVLAGDFARFGRAMIANTEAQRRLHGALVSPVAQTIIDIAARHGAAGWKVNGAGGEGGSLTILGGPSWTRTRALARAIRQENEHCEVIPTYLSRYGVRVWKAKNF